MCKQGGNKPAFTAAQQHSSWELTSGAASMGISSHGQTTWFIHVYYSVTRSEISQTQKGSDGPALPLRLLESSRSDRKQARHRGWIGIWDEELVSLGPTCSRCRDFVLVIPALERLRQKDQPEFQVSLGFRVSFWSALATRRPHLKIK